MALTEEQAWEIRKLGITVIEWKWCVKENVNVFIYIMNKAIGKATVFIYIMNKAIGKATGISL